MIRMADTIGFLDPLPPVDPLQGMQPPFAVDLHDVVGSETVEVFPTIFEAARFASRLHRRRYRGQRIEITDQRGRVA